LCTEIPVFESSIFLLDGQKGMDKPLIFKAPLFARSMGSLLKRAPARRSGVSRGRLSTSLSTVFVDIQKNPLNPATYPDRTAARGDWVGPLFANTQ
jgi:hypothetical protein